MSHKNLMIKNGKIYYKKNGGEKNWELYTLYLTYIVLTKDCIWLILYWLRIVFDYMSYIHRLVAKILKNETDIFFKNKYYKMNIPILINVKIMQNKSSQWRTECIGYNINFYEAKVLKTVSMTVKSTRRKTSTCHKHSIENNVLLRWFR